jgi:acyl carrier protein
MERTTITEKITPVFRKVLNEASLEITDQLSASDVDNWDSLSHMLLISEIESTFNIKFKLKELNKMKNVGDLISFISTKLEE